VRAVLFNALYSILSFWKREHCRIELRPATRSASTIALRVAALPPGAERISPHCRRRWRGCSDPRSCSGDDQVSAERQARRAVLEALPIEEQRRIYEVFYHARKRAEAGDFSQPAIETTVSNGPEHRNGADEPDDADNAT
jgi:hypothetical protein